MEYSKKLREESWYLDKIQKIGREMGWQTMQLLNL